MAIYRVSGNILQDNLQRGANLSIQGNLIYFDVTNDKVGILTSTPTEILTVTGNLSAGNIKIDTDTVSGLSDIILAPTGNISASNNYINNVTDPVQPQDAATKYYVDSVAMSGFTVEDSTANTTTISGGDTLQLLGTNNQVSVLITAVDQVTFGLPNDVTIGNTLSVTGNLSAANISTVGNVTANNVIINAALANSVLFTDSTGTLSTTSNLTFDGSTMNMQGNTIIDNINIDGTSITSNANLTLNTTTGNLVFNLLANGITQFNSTSSLTLPAGNTAQRPVTPDSGTIRWNTNTLVVEVWNGTTWEPVGQDFVQITSQIINGDGSTTIFTLDKSTTAAGILVSTNGVVQYPDISYAVTGNLITFAEAPQIADQVEVRFTSSVTTITAIANASGNAEIQVTAQGVANIASCDSLQLPSYTVTQAANIASPASGQLIYVSNGDSGNPCLAVYSGGGWKRVTLGSNIST